MTVDLISRAAGFRSINEETRSIEFVASTDAVDSYDEIVSQENWHLERFTANPVILFAHNSRELPIGHATRCEVVSVKGKKQLECTIQIATAEANPNAELVWQSIKQKTLRSVSVGFYPRTVRSEKRDDKLVYVLDDNELFEISVVPIPANPEALAKMRSKARESAHRTPNDSPAAVATQEKTMNFALIAATLGVAAASNASEQDILSAAKAAKDKADRADIAERDLADAKKKLAETEGKLTESTKALDTALADKVKADAAREAAEKSAKEAGDKLIEAEVEALVGVKITPAEKDEMVEFAKESPVRFKKQMALRADMKTLGGQVISSTEKSGPAPTTATNNGKGEDLAALIAADADADSEDSAA